MHIEFHLHTNNLFVRGYHPWKKHSSSVIYVGKLPIRPWCLVCYLLFCQRIFFESLTWLKAYTALSWFDGFYSAISKKKNPSPCVFFRVYVCSCRSGLFVFSSSVSFKIEKLRKCFALKTAPISKPSICVEDEDSGAFAFILKLNMK